VAGIRGDVPLPLPAVRAGAVAAAPTAGVPPAPRVQRATALRQDLPATLNEAVQQPESALVVALALAVSTAAELQSAQRRIVADAFGDDLQQAVQIHAVEVATLAPTLHMPLLALAFPALKQLPEGRQQTLLAALDALVRVDGRVDLDEYCLVRLLRVQLLESRQPHRTPPDGVKKLPACRRSLMLVCGVVAMNGTTDEAAARRAWLLAMQYAFPGEAIGWSAPPPAWQQPFERALDDLDGLLPAAKELVIQSLARAIHADGQVSVEEASLLRVICASLHCPLPL
jgi:hypothetical protein